MFLADSVHTLLFQGDSITDCQRNRDCHASACPPNLMGDGFASIAAMRLCGEFPASDMRCLNRACAGDTVAHLRERWERDTLAHQPDLLNLLIGVNDTWSVENRVELDDYARILRELLDATRQASPSVQFVLCEPFFLPIGAAGSCWHEELGARSRIVRELAEVFGACFVPFQSLFDALASHAPMNFWLPDGVHPSPGAHAIMADFWLKLVADIEPGGPLSRQVIATLA